MRRLLPAIEQPTRTHTLATYWPTPTATATATATAEHRSPPCCSLSTLSLPKHCQTMPRCKSPPRAPRQMGTSPTRECQLHKMAHRQPSSRRVRLTRPTIRQPLRKGVPAWWGMDGQVGKPRAETSRLGLEPAQIIGLRSGRIRS